MTSDFDAFVVCLVERDGYRRYHVSREGTPAVAVREAFNDLRVTEAKNVRKALVFAIEDMQEVEVPKL